MSWRLNVEPEFDNVGPQVDHVEAALGRLSSVDPTVLSRFMRSRTPKDTGELSSALHKLWVRCPRHLQWRARTPDPTRSPRRPRPADGEPGAVYQPEVKPPTPRRGKPATPRAKNLRTPPRRSSGGVEIRGGGLTPRSQTPQTPRTPRTPRSATPTQRVGTGELPATPERATTAPGGMRRRKPEAAEGREGSVTPLQQEVADPRPYRPASEPDDEVSPEREERLHHLRLISRRKMMMSTYRDSFRHPEPGKNDMQHKAACFPKMVRPEYMPTVDAWQEDEADEDAARKLADHLRAINSMKSYDEGKRKTEYTVAFKGEQGHVDKRREIQMKDGEGLITLDLRHRNYSRVPVGSIYEIDSWEIEASREREREQQKKAEALVARQAEQCRAAAAKEFTPVQLCMYPARNAREPTEVQRLFKIQNMPSGRTKWASEYRLAYLHGKKAAQ